MAVRGLFRDYTRSSSFQMAVFFTVLCGLSVVVLLYLGSYFSHGPFVKGAEKTIDTEMKYVVPLYDDGRLNDFVRDNAGDHDRLYLFYDGGDSNLAGVPAEISLLAEGIVTFSHTQNGRLYAAKIHTFGDGKKLLIGVDITDVAADYAFMEKLSIASIVMMLVVIVFSFLISRFVVVGTNRIASTAWEIMDTGDLSRRLEVGSSWDDLSNMAAALNALFDRVEELLHGVRQVSDNIAHDLRTPLARLRNHIETLYKDNPKPEYQDLLGEVDHLLSTFNALLRISRIEFEKQRERFADVDVSALVHDVVEFYEPMAEDGHVRLTTHIDYVSVRGDRDLLFQAFANILDNAIKFSPNGGQVEVRLSALGQGMQLEVIDAGLGIDDADKTKIFDRFYRVAKCRSLPGTGLGLSLVAAVVALHGGTVEAHDAHPGSRIVVTL